MPLLQPLLSRLRRMSQSLRQPMVPQLDRQLIGAPKLVLAGEFEIAALVRHLLIAFQSSRLQEKHMIDGQAVVLSAREKECLRWVEEGKSSWEIGGILRISQNTVDFHIKNAMRKLDVTTRIQCAIKARRLGLL
ncbi:LuxR C-terminal-related transcriptional regulator [Bradyrhizobium lupini]|uniref:helix-turn-helix transcriptional regulator n=1 Tax=Bradyrhizobium TaxID=374 RepID=UPI0028F06C4B|nr:helix-turn-helix transcriptional regulator [Bradyrhizobium cosmicum]